MATFNSSSSSNWYVDSYSTPNNTYTGGTITTIDYNKEFVQWLNEFMKDKPVLLTDDVKEINNKLAELKNKDQDGGFTSTA